MAESDEKARLRRRMYGVVAAKLRALAAEADVMRAQVLVVVDETEVGEGHVITYLDKLRESLLARSSFLEREALGG